MDSKEEETVWRGCGKCYVGEVIGAVEFVFWEGEDLFVDLSADKFETEWGGED